MPRLKFYDKTTEVVDVAKIVITLCASIMILVFVITGALILLEEHKVYSSQKAEDQTLPLTSGMSKLAKSEYTLVNTYVIATGSEPIVIYTVKHKSGSVYKFSTHNVVQIK